MEEMSRVYLWNRVFECISIPVKFMGKTWENFWESLRKWKGAGGALGEEKGSWPEEVEFSHFCSQFWGGIGLSGVVSVLFTGMVSGRILHPVCLL
ncbi:hypothetical protein ACFX12_022745 [Malus domestica]